MKTTLNHLPEHKQAELKTIVRALIPRYADIEMIVLFGSYARGNWVEDVYTEKGITYEYKSDYDLLIILSNNGKANSETLTFHITGIIDALGLLTPVSPIFHGIDFINKELSDGNYFFNDIKDDGIILFNTSRYELAPKRELSPEEVKAKAERDFTNWFESANVFFQQYKYAYNDGHLKESAFLLHQSAERYYNALQLVFTGYKAKTHDIEVLSKLANTFDIRFNKVFPRVTIPEKHRFTLLKKAYIDARYNMDYTITKEDLTYLSERVSLLKELTETICKEKISALINA